MFLLSCFRISLRCTNDQHFQFNCFVFVFVITNIICFLHVCLQVLARRKEGSGKVKVLLHWTPEDMWVKLLYIVYHTHRPQETRYRMFQNTETILDFGLVNQVQFLKKTWFILFIFSVLNIMWYVSTLLADLADIFCQPTHGGHIFWQLMKRWVERFWILVNKLEK